MQRQPAFFVPNLGQWNHPARFVHRSGPMTLLLEERGWAIDLVERPAAPAPREPSDRTTDGERQESMRGVLLRMQFEGAGHVPRTIGEQRLPGHHNYFLGNDESRWRTHVPLYESVRYEGLYDGIDVRLRHANGAPEYDLLLQPGADLAAVTVRVDGADHLAIDRDGSLVIETALGPVTQPAPRTWEVTASGERRAVACHFVLLAHDRFGFAAPDWNGGSPLTIDPGLIWSTFLGGGGSDLAHDLSVDASGLMTVAGTNLNGGFPTTTGAYQRTGNVGSFISRLDPSKTGTAQLVYSTYLNQADIQALAVDAQGVVTVAGHAFSSNFPTTSGAFDTTYNGNWDAFVSRLDPALTGTAQLVYSTFLGGTGKDLANAVWVDASGVVTVGGTADSSDFPTTSGSYDTTHNGQSDAFVSRVDPNKVGAAQLVYSTFLGGSYSDELVELSVDGAGVATVVGVTNSPNFPTTSGAYDTTNNGREDAFVARLDSSKTGSAQLVYSTFLGGSSLDETYALSVGPGELVTLAGLTVSSNFPTTGGAYDTTYSGYGDAFVTRLDTSKGGSAQLVYSTFLGGGYWDRVDALSVDAVGVITVAGSTASSNFPTTSGAFDRTINNSTLSEYDVFVSRLDPSRTGAAQLVYSTFLGGQSWDSPYALSVDGAGVATVVGVTKSQNFPTTSGAYDTTHSGTYDAFIFRLSMGLTFYADRYELSLKQAGTQQLTLEAGRAHAGRSYWIFGSLGTSPGITLGGVHIPLNPDPYTEFTLNFVNSAVLDKFRGTLDGNGNAQASFHVPANLPPAVGITVHHAYVVYDGTGGFHMASNPVPLVLK